MVNQEVVALIDRSGSMHGKEADTVGGINAMLDELKSTKTENDTIKVSIKLFDNEQVLKLRSVDLDSVDNFPLSEFVPRGTTALLDAIGDTLTYFMEKKLQNPTAYDNCMVYVATDGLENTSHKYNRSTITKMIKSAKEVYNINILYLGANQDAILEAGAIGINADQAINYSETQENVEAVFRSAGAVASRTRSTGVNDGFTPAERTASCSQSQESTNTANNLVNDAHTIQGLNVASCLMPSRTPTQMPSYTNQ